MSGKDVLRERVARALWDEEIDRCGVTGKRRDIAREVAPPEFYDDADAVIVALGLTEDWDEDCWDGGSIPIRRWTTPWERIEEDA